jgi:hypothetical protein
MSEAQHPDDTRRDSGSPDDYVPDARGVLAGIRRKSGNRKGQAKNPRTAEEEHRDALGSLCSEALAHHILDGSDDGKRFELSFPFITKLADNIVSLRNFYKDDKHPVLHSALLLTTIYFYGGEHSLRVSELTAFLEEAICEDLEFKLTNK